MTAAPAAPSSPGTINDLPGLTSTAGAASSVRAACARRGSLASSSCAARAAADALACPQPRVQRRLEPEPLQDGWVRALPAAVAGREVGGDVRLELDRE